MTHAVDALILERDDDSFLYRTMQEHRTSILGVVQRFKTLDPLYDHEDLEQEAFFGVRSAALHWEDARAINMQFKTYLNWHISRHFQAKFKGDDKIVDIFDRHDRLLVSIPYRKYRKHRRAITQEKGYSTRIRSLLVYYDDPAGETREANDTARSLGASLHVDGDRVVDVYNTNDELIITLPFRAYTRMSHLIRSQGYRAETYSIYDPPARSTTGHASPFTSLPPAPQPAVQMPVAPRASDSTTRRSLSDHCVVDVYTRRRIVWMRLTPDQYKAARPHIDFLGGVVKFHHVETYPEQPTYEELLDHEPASSDARAYEEVAYRGACA